ncbi:hypothetical protein ABZ958_36925 [Streptomyces sp. NPDC046237]|uniref:hypothetical protein n=1 Tax=Streptomyces sp. NPDC046237 TaxID=3154914 RepID=UPI0033C8DF7C
MSKVFAGLGMSPHDFRRPRLPVYDAETRRARQNVEGGRTEQDDDTVRENFDRSGAYVMGRQGFAERANIKDLVIRRSGHLMLGAAAHHAVSQAQNYLRTMDENRKEILARHGVERSSPVDARVLP